jgi:hypothetical protein
MNWSQGHAVEYLYCKWEAQSSNSSPTKKKKSDDAKNDDGKKKNEIYLQAKDLISIFYAIANVNLV